MSPISKTLIFILILVGIVFIFPNIVLLYAYSWTVAGVVLAAGIAGTIYLHRRIVQVGFTDLDRAQRLFAPLVFVETITIFLILGAITGNYLTIADDSRSNMGILLLAPAILIPIFHAHILSRQSGVRMKVGSIVWPLIGGILLIPLVVLVVFMLIASQWK